MSELENPRLSPKKYNSAPRVCFFFLPPASSSFCFSSLFFFNRLSLSSMTTLAPPALCTTPSVLSTSMKSTASWASASVVATTTPLPAARPSALTTIGTPTVSMWVWATAGSVKVA